MVKRAFLTVASGVLTVLLVGSGAFAAGPGEPRPAKSDPVYRDEVHSPLEHTGTWKGESKPWSAPRGGVPKQGEIGPDSGLWWGGWYFDAVSNTLLLNSARRDGAVAFKMLGRGVCMDQSETTSATGSLTISGTGKFNDTISGSFGFTASGTHTFSLTYKYCGPSDSSAYRYRYFYQQLIYNKYRSDVLRCYWWWIDTLDHCESESDTVYVPYMATYSVDSN
jgi:hypothetical protein